MKRLVQCVSIIACCLLTAGCTRSSAPATHVVAARSEKSAELPALDWLKSPTSLAHLGPTEGLEPGHILRRGVTLHTDAGDMELKNGVLTHGDANNAWQDTETGKLAWRAHTCMNPACPSGASQAGPYLFVHAPAGAKLDAAGDVHVPGAPQPAVPPCPKCGKDQWVCEFELPEVVRRRAELEEELQASRAVRRGAAAVPAGVRPPMEIIPRSTG